MRRIRTGNDFRFVWVIERNSQAEDLTLATNLVLTIKSMYGDSAIPFTIADGNKVCVDIDSKNAGNIAKYNLRLTYTIPDDSLADGFRDCAVDIDAFEIVAKTELAEKVDEFTSTSEIAIGFQGDSAFRVWQLQAGNEGKTYEDYIAFLQKPATDAAALVGVAIENANEAAAAANESALLVQDSADNADAKAILANNAAILATEKASLADSKATLANDKAILAQSAADNANAKAAEVTAAILSAGSLGSIKPTDPAPTPARNGNYTFSIGGNKPAWLTAEALVTTVKAGDGVAVVFTAPSGYSYTHVDTGSAIEQVRSQNQSKCPSSKLLDDNLDLKVSKKIGVNLFNKNNLISGYYINSANGNAGVNANYYASDFIPVLSSTSYFCGNGYHLAYYDQNKTYISGISGLISWPISTPSTAKYLKFSLLKSQSIDNVQLELGTIATTYKSYTELNESVTTESIKNGAITPEKIKNGAITPEKANFFEPQKNKFNINDVDVVFGKYVLYTSGSLLDNAAYNSTGYIPVIAEKNYAFNAGAQSAWFDANKNYISGVVLIAGTHASPVGAAYIRCSVYATQWNTFKVEEGTISTAYEPYAVKIKQEYAPTDSYFPSISLTRKLHVLANNENSVYHKSMIERWNPYRYLIQSSGTNWLYFERYARVNAASAGNLTYSVYDGVTLSLKQSKTATVVVGNPATNNGAKIVQVIGDSFSYNGYWFDKTNQLCPALTFVGLRKSYNTLLKAEGRGGWTLSSYIKNKHVVGDSFSPFIHPADPYKYYGNTAFWIAVKAGSSDYGIAGFTDIANTIGFNATTGLKAAPAENDVMYNNVNARYEVYNSSAWVEIAEATLAFTFNYAKYLSTWGIVMPDIVGVMLGCNDFRSVVLTDNTFATWKTNMDTLLTSVRSAATALGKTVKIAICLPMTETASANNSASINPAFQRANMFDARRRIIDAFDKDDYSTIGIDVVDTGTAIDGDFGYEMSEIKPFSDYAGTQKEMYSNNAPHPNNGGYSQLGIRFAAYVQSIR